MKSITPGRLFVMVIIVIAIIWFLFISDLGSSGNPSAMTPAPPVIFTAVAKEEDLICYVENSINDSKAIISKFRIVGVVGKDITSKWALLRTEEYADCWVLLDFLDTQGNNIDASPLIITSSPPILSPLVYQPEQPTEAPEQPTEVSEQPTEVSEQPTEASEQPTEASELILDVDVKFTVVECACGGKSGQADVILTFMNGAPPYVVNGQAPVQGDTVTFRTSLGVSFDLGVVDANGNEWKEEDIEAPYCSDDHCEKQTNPGPTDPGPTDPGSTDSCTVKEVQVCEDIVTTVDVCIKWPPGNPNNCLEWGKQQKTDRVCHIEEVCE